MKINRTQVYNKYGGKCAYCGSDVAFSNFQVDHILPICQGGTNEAINLLPTCRQCNHYKRSANLEQYRYIMSNLHSRISDIYIFKVARNFKMTDITPFDGVFYFEKLKLKYIDEKSI